MWRGSALVAARGFCPRALTLGLSVEPAGPQVDVGAEFEQRFHGRAVVFRDDDRLRQSRKEVFGGLFSLRGVSPSRR